MNEKKKIVEEMDALEKQRAEELKKHNKILTKMHKEYVDLEKKIQNKKDIIDEEIKAKKVKLNKQEQALFEKKKSLDKLQGELGNQQKDLFKVTNRLEAEEKERKKETDDLFKELNKTRAILEKELNKAKEDKKLNILRYEELDEKEIELNKRQENIDKATCRHKKKYDAYLLDLDKLDEISKELEKEKDLIQSVKETVDEDLHFITIRSAELDQREKKVRVEIEDAKKAKEKAEKLKSDYEELIEDAWDAKSANEVLKSNLERQKKELDNREVKLNSKEKAIKKLGGQK